MPKISSLNVKSVIIKFIVKSLALTTTSIILISSVASFIIFKLDLDLSYCKYAGYLISALTSFIVPFICLKPFKNNILFLSFLSIIPLVLFTLANFIFFWQGVRSIIYIIGNNYCSSICNRGYVGREEKVIKIEWYSYWT